MPHPYTFSARACVVVVLMTTAPVAEAANSRSSACDPDHAPEAFIRHDGKGMLASVVDNTVIIHLLDGAFCDRLITGTSARLQSVSYLALIVLLSGERGQATKGTNQHRRSRGAHLDRSARLRDNIADIHHYHPSPLSR
jgi:hypothetical protein